MKFILLSIKTIGTAILMSPFFLIGFIIRTILTGLISGWNYFETFSIKCHKEAEELSRKK